VRPRAPPSRAIILALLSYVWVMPIVGARETHFLGARTCFRRECGQLLTVLTPFASVSRTREGRSSAPEGRFSAETIATYRRGKTGLG
jgi:hypothetical protein